MSDSQGQQGKTIYLGGGRVYFFTGSLQLYKGIKLATNPDDLAEGKGRAKVYLYHPQILDTSGDNSISTSFFMLGRLPEGDESPMVVMDIGKIQIEDIDFAIPMVNNVADGTVVTNSYFMNMYVGVMGSVIELLSIKNCSFQGIVGGFIRMQGNYGVRIKELTIDNCDFYNGGYYNDGGRRYNWFNANPEANPTNNMWENFTMRNCTIYDNPLGYLFNHNKQTSVEWPDDLHYNITLENNTFVNFNTCNVSNSLLFSLRWIPGGSSFIMKRNLFVLTRQEGDDLREMVQAGCDIRTVNGSGTVLLDFEDNYSTNDYLFDEVDAKTGVVTKQGQIFSNRTSAFDFTGEKTFGGLNKNYTVTWGLGKSEDEGMAGLTVIAAPIKSTDLMVQPCPPHKLGAEANHYDHMEDGIDGTVSNPDATIRKGYRSGMVDLHFKSEAKTVDNVLYRKQIGASKWRTN